MDSPWKANDRVDALANQIASEICDMSLSVEDASNLFALAVKTAHWNVTLGVAAPEFQSRALEHQQTIAALEIANGRQTLIDQLFALRIDPAPALADLPPGGD